jgi:hypothetical protein
MGTQTASGSGARVLDTMRAVTVDGYWFQSIDTLFR